MKGRVVFSPDTFIKKKLSREELNYTRIALYARVSTVKQAEKDQSKPDQLQQIRDRR